MLLVCSGLLIVTPAVVSAQGYKVVKKAALGGDGGWDYLKVDPDARRLYVSRGTRVIVVDVDTLAPVGEIPDTPGVHGIAIASDLGRGFISNGRADTATIFDLTSLKALGQVKTGANPDAILYDALTHRVFVFNGRSGDVTVIDAKAGTVTATIPVGGKLEFGVTDGKGRIFVNVEDKNEIVALDAQGMKVAAHWPLTDCEEPTGLAIDAAHRRLFAACGNKHMAVVDADTGRSVATLPIGDGSDGAGFDPEGQNAFSSNGGDGTLTVVHESTPDKFEVVQTVATQRSARTMTIDPKTHNVFTVAAEFGERPAPTADQPNPRPPVLPGTFSVLVVGR
jgi:YVTN family beta-propeller protein